MRTRYTRPATQTQPRQIAPPDLRCTVQCSGPRRVRRRPAPGARQGERTKLGVRRAPPTRPQAPWVPRDRDCQEMSKGVAGGSQGLAQARVGSRSHTARQAESPRIGERIVQARGDVLASSGVGGRCRSGNRGRLPCAGPSVAGRVGAPATGAGRLPTAATPLAVSGGALPAIVGMRKPSRADPAPRSEDRCFAWP